MTKEKQQEWDMKDKHFSSADPLLSCLLFLTKHFDNPQSAVSLTERLPLENHKLTPQLFVRAAKRANLAANIYKAHLKEIDEISMPLVLLLHNGQACVLLEKEADTFTVLLAEGGITQLKQTELAGKYTGYAIYVKPLFHYTHRQKKSKHKSPQYLLWSVLMSSWPIYSEVLMASALINLFALALPLFVMNVYDRVVPNNAVETMWVLASGILIVFLFDLLLKTLRAYFIDTASKKTDIQLSSIIFEHILGIKMAARPSSVGAFANTIQSFEIFRDFIASTTITVLVDLPFVLIYLFVIYYIGGGLVIIPAVILPVVLILGVLIQYPLRSLTKTNYELAQEKHATLIESLSGIEAIKSTGAEGTMQGRFENVVSQSAKLSAKLKFWVSWSIHFTILMQQLASVAVILYGVYKISLGDLTIGGLIACTILTGRALAPMAQVAGIFSRYYQSVKALRGIEEVMKLPTDVSPDSQYLHRPNLKGKVECKKTAYSYPNQTIAVLENVSFTINPGERVAIIGRTGSGKSTIAKLIIGLYQPSNGSVYIDNTDYLQINPADLRKQIGYVPQDVVLFYGSVRDNIRLGSHYVEDEEIRRVGKIAGVTTFTDNHPEGFDRNVEERGCNLSAGQRQTIAIARSLIHSPNILIMDEPTSSMDDGLEKQLRDNLKKHLSKETTLILITHKATMLDMVDRLIVTDKGRIVADGPKDSVLSALRGGIKLS